MGEFNKLLLLLLLLLLMLRLSLTEFISWHPRSGSAGQSIGRLEMVWRSRQPTRKQQSYRVVSECLLPFKTHTNDTLLLWPALGSPGASSDALCRKLRESGHAVPSFSFIGNDGKHKKATTADRIEQAMNKRFNC